LSTGPNHVISRGQSTDDAVSCDSDIGFQRVLKMAVRALQMPLEMVLTRLSRHFGFCQKRSYRLPARHTGPCDVGTFAAACSAIAAHVFSAVIECRAPCPPNLLEPKIIPCGPGVKSASDTFESVLLPKNL